MIVKNRFFLFLFVLPFCYFYLTAAEGGGGAGSFDIPQVDKSKWVDPNDFQFHSSAPSHGSQHDEDDILCPDRSEMISLQSALSSCRLELNEMKLNPAKLLHSLTPSIDISSNTPTCSCSNDPTLLKHVVHRILIKLNLETKLDELKKSDYLFEANLRFSASDVRTLQRFLDTSAPDMNLIQDARMAMETFLRKVRRIRAVDEEPTFWENFWTSLGFYLQIGNLLVLLPAAALVLKHIWPGSLRRLALFSFFVIFCLSCVWTWLHLYKVKQAERQARYAKIGVPRECFPEQQSAYQAFSAYFVSLIRFPQPDECLQYYKDIMIDPYWEVTPTEAIAITASKLVLRPLAILGEHLADFITAFYSRLPLTVAPFATILLLVFGLFALLLVFGYRIRLPLWLGVIEPGHREIVHQHVGAPPAANIAAHQQLPAAAVDNNLQQLPSGPAQLANAALPQGQLLPEERDRSRAGGSSQDRARLALRDSTDEDAQQLRRRAPHRSISLPRVRDGDR